MKFEHYLKRVEESKEFKKFQENNKKAYLSAGFFVLDFEKGKHMHQVDYFIPESKKIATFILDKGVSMKVSEMKFKGKKPLELDSSSNLDLDALKGIVHDEMMNRTVTQEIKKIIAVLINEDGKKVWKLNCITGDLGIIKVNVDDSNSGILEFEKASLFDMMKMIPKEAAPPAIPQSSHQGIQQPQVVQIQPQQTKTKEKPKESIGDKKANSNIPAKRGKK